MGLVAVHGIAIEKPTMVARDKADDAVDTECIDKESNAGSGCHGAVFLRRISDSGHYVGA